MAELDELSKDIVREQSLLKSVIEGLVKIKFFRISSDCKNGGVTAAAEPFIDRGVNSASEKAALLAISANAEFLELGRALQKLPAIAPIRREDLPSRYGFNAVDNQQIELINLAIVGLNSQIAEYNRLVSPCNGLESPLATQREGGEPNGLIKVEPEHFGLHAPSGT